MTSSEAKDGKGLRGDLTIEEDEPETKVTPETVVWAPSFFEKRDTAIKGVIQRV